MIDDTQPTERIQPDRLYSRRQAAEFIGVSVPTMERWSRQGVGPMPRYLREAPRRPRYLGADILGVIEAATTARPALHDAAA